MHHVVLWLSAQGLFPRSRVKFQTQLLPAFSMRNASGNFEHVYDYTTTGETLCADVGQLMEPVGKIVSELFVSRVKS